MIFITGPRQVGKTFLAKQIMQNFPKSQYLNFDNTADREIIIKEKWKRNSELIVLDEIHKMKNWKLYLKGMYDAREEHQKFLITGSARMETFRQTGESLAGRYFHYHLLPLSVKELQNSISPYEVVDKLNRFGGFPEPFLADSATERARWENQYYTDLIREDILDYSKIHEIRLMRVLLELLRGRAGTTVSYTGLAGDLQVSPNTVKSYLGILEALYIIFLIFPFHRNIARAVLKEPKIYFYDSGYVNADEGIKLENTCAVSLLKHVRFLRDVRGDHMALHYIRTKDKKEVDFVLVENDRPAQLIEVKLSDEQVSKNLKLFKRKLPGTQAVQLVHNLRQEYEHDGIQVVKAGAWLGELSA
jgi:predicted AAA+ superfamily ATPase